MDAAECAVYVATLLAEFTAKEVCEIKIKCYVDSKSLVDAIYSTKAVQDKQLRINIAVLRDMLAKKDIQSVSWVRSAKQLANPLTKRGANCNPLLAALSGSYAVSE